MHDPLSRVPIKYKLTGAFVGICIIAFGVGGYLISSSAGNTLESEITARLETQAAVISGRLEHQLELFGRRAEDFASDGFIRTHIMMLSDSTLTLKEHREVAERLRLHLAINKLPLVDRVANLSVITNDLKFTSSVYPAWYMTDWSIVKQGALQDTLWGCRFIARGDSSQPVFGIFTPLRDIQSRDRIGTLVFWIDIKDWLEGSDLLHALGASADGRATLSLTDPVGEVFNVGIRHDSITGVHPIHGRNAAPSGGTFPHAALFAFNHVIDHWGWQVNVGMDATKSMESVSALQSRFLGGGILVAIAAMVLLFFPVQFLIRPLDKMRDAARAMMDGDYSVRVAAVTEDEIGELARSFNKMAAATQERTTKLEETARLLEKRSVELRVERDLLTTVIHSMEDGVIYLNTEGHVVLHNQKAENLALRLHGDGNGVVPYACEGNGNCEQTCSRCLTRQNIAKPHCTVACGDVIYEVLSANVAADNNEYGRILVARDITGRERISERQAHHDRLAVLGEVAARMAHELNNPLAAASMFAQMISRETNDEFPYWEHVDVIMRNIDVCKRTIQDLLNYARSSRMEVTDFDLEVCTGEVVRFLRPVYEKREIAFDMEFCLQNTIVRTDETYLRQAMINVIMNAIQALESSGTHIWISAVAADDDNDITLEIRDNGPGIPVDMQTKIFEPFVTSKPAGEGTGLGLSISRTIMRNIGGELALIASEPGETVFRLTIPRIPDRKEERELLEGHTAYVS